MRDLGLVFTVDSSDVDETLAPGAAIASAVSELALSKARDVARRHPEALVIGADTLVALGMQILSKPRDPDDARAMLRSLSANCHRVYTGLVAIDAATQTVESRLVETDVYFRELTDAEIEGYLRTGEPFDKAGSYGAQGLGSTFIQRIDGDYFNVVGLPLAELNDVLRGFGACVICRRLQSPVQG
jgi:septum formation protein